LVRKKDYDVVLSIRVPLVLVEKLDKIVKEKGYRSRAEAIRAAIREFVEKYEKKEKKASRLL